MLDALDYHYDENEAHGLSQRPSGYFRRQIYACFWFKRGDNLVRDIRRIGVDNCMFETDFPHPTRLYPEPLRHIAPRLRDVEPSFRQKVRSTNAARVYNIDLDRL
jgi:hypothetical protein